ncbi:MAG: hypothetical protein R3E56_01400 [Burkholderiaceae bacterium]
MLPDDPQAAVLAQGGPANPLADLIGWPGAAGLPIGAEAASAQGRKGSADPNGTSIEGMTLVDQPTDADADLAARLKAPATPSASAATDTTAPDKDAASVTYGDSPNATEGGAETAKSTRGNPVAMGARATSWRSTTTLAPTAGGSHRRPRAHRPRTTTPPPSRPTQCNRPRMRRSSVAPWPIPYKPPRARSAPAVSASATPAPCRPPPPN